MATFGLDIFKYFIAQGVIHHQPTIVCTASSSFHSEVFINALPQVLSGQKKKEEGFSSSSTIPNLSQLNIAWQYKKYSRTSESTRYCHSFDLSRPMQSDLVDQCPPISMEYSSMSDLIVQIERILLAEKNIQRVALYDIEMPVAGVTEESLESWIQSILHLKRLVRKHNLTCLLSFKRDLFPSNLRHQMGHLCDAIFHLDCFAESQNQDELPVELQEFVGVCFVRKLPRLHSLACHIPSARTYGITRDRRKLKILPLHLPPEESRSNSKIDF